MGNRGDRSSKGGMSIARTARTASAASTASASSAAKKIVALFAACTLAALVAVGMAGCGGTSGTSGSTNSSGSTQTASEKTDSIVIGTLATEDILPMWVAEEEGLFAQAGVNAQVQVFQSATELIAGITSGEVDLAMTDPMVTASISASGTPVRIQWITLGTTADQGRFGIMTSDSSITSLSDLAGVEIGVGSNTILEYVMDTLMTRAGVPEDQIKKSELQKLPVRYEAMASGQVKAAALPASLLALGEASGCKTVADDTQGDNISQSVMIVRDAFLQAQVTGTSGTTMSGQQAVEALKGVWNTAATNINNNPESYRALLVNKANLSDKVADTYAISTYPMCEMPTNQMIDPVLNWMVKKGYLTSPLTYDAAQGTFSKQS